MALGMEVGIGPGDFVFDEDPATPRTEGTPTTTQFLAHVYCGQTAGWMKTPLGTEVDLGSGHIVLDVVPALREQAQQTPAIFSARVYCGHGRRSQLLLSSCYIYICCFIPVSSRLSSDYYLYVIIQRFFLENEHEASSAQSRQ